MNVLLKMLCSCLLILSLNSCALFSIPRIDPPKVSQTTEEKVNKDIEKKSKDINATPAKTSKDAADQISDLKQKYQAAQLVVADYHQKIKLKTEEYNDLKREEVTGYLHWIFGVSFVLSFVSVIGGLFLYIRLQSTTGRTIAVCGVIGILTSLAGLYYAAYWQTIAMWVGIIIFVGLIIEAIIIFEKNRDNHLSTNIKKKVKSVEEDIKTEVNDADAAIKTTVGAVVNDVKQVDEKALNNVK